MMSLPPRKVFLLLLLNIYFRSGFSNINTNPKVGLDTPGLIKKYGYPVEIHRVVTKDGYILELHRIPNSPYNKDSQRNYKRPVLLQHGLAGSSADWIILGPKNSLGLFLADAGYDVWLGNNRGNVYSRNHTSMLPTDRYFWDFSFHELGTKDLPAIIDYIVYQTGQQKLFYVGHSQGTTQFLVMTSERPEYNSRVILMAGLAPAAYTSNLRGPVTKLTKLTYFGVWVGENFGYPELTSRSEWGKYVSSLLCDNKAPTQFLCNNMLFLITGFSPDELEMENLAVIIGHVPAGASWKQVIHFGQGYINPGYFRQFDYGQSKTNLKVYGSSVPPEYALERITAPVALFSSDNDWLATPPDVERLYSRLSNVVLDYKVPMDKFNHYDFLWGKFAPQLIFEPLLRLFETH